MKIIYVKSLPLKEVIQDLAKEFNTGYTEDCEEYKLELPPDIGKGCIRGINFRSGLGVLLYECCFIEDMEIRFTVNKIHPAKFLYCMEGHLEHRFSNEEHEHRIGRYKNAIVASSHHHGHILCFDKNVNTQISSLEIDRNEFIKKIECNLEEIDSPLNKLFLDVRATQAFYHDGNYSLKLSELLTEIENFEQKGVIRRIFLEGKSLQILTQQILQYKDDLENATVRSLLRKSEVDVIHQAATLIRQELDQPDTVQSLANRLGTNVNKLQEGFKQLYNTTVNAYVKQARLEAASRLLKSSEMNISEIVYAIGLSNRSYFSKIFKEQYGVLPKQYRMAAKKRKKKQKEQNV